MISSLLLATLTLYASTAVSQSTTPTIVCAAGQCLQGFSNTTIGAKLSASGSTVTVQLLPGQYSSDTDPQLLHDLLTSSTASLSPSPGFENATAALPLNLQLNSGISAFSDSLYSGQSAFSALPSQPINNISTPIPGKSLALSSSIWIAVTSDNTRTILWDSVPDVSQLPITGSLSLTDIQSTACSPACSGNGICSASGTCTCPTGFTGSSCETCAEGFFGPKCLPCPSDCDKCDEGLTGSGRCLKPLIANAPSTCNCLNGQCGSNGECTCNTGWTTATNGTACGKCSDGFFLTSTGDCKTCNPGCATCSDGDGVCTTCKPTFTRNANDQTKCDAVRSSSSDGTLCAPGTFSDSGNCRACDTSCDTCSGATSNDCTACPRNSYLLNGVCLAADTNGVCKGTTMVGNNEKQSCDTCGAKCTSCQIPNFSITSTVKDIKCTACLPGSFLSGSQCVDTCPDGSFLSSDNTTCTTCDSSCSTCSGPSDFCLTCPSGQLASDGKCVTTCPEGTFTSGGSCLPCHSDCGTCSGSSFNQCSTCASNRPVLANGRCLPTCSKAQFFDPTSSSCQACDSSCGSCSGRGPSKCLSCSSSSQVLRAGSCKSADCKDNSSVVPGLGVCLSELVDVPQPSGTQSAAPLPTVTGIDAPTVINSSRRPLEWWQILLMALGCAFIFLLFLMCWRRRARKRRAQRTAAFANAKALNDPKSWRNRLVRFGERLFGHEPSKARLVIRHPSGVWPPPRVGGATNEAYQLKKLRDAEEARSSKDKEDDDMENIIDAYQYSRYSKAPSPTSLHHHHHHHHHNVDSTDRLNPNRPYRDNDSKRLSGSSSSIYSQITGVPRRIPEPRVPIKEQDKNQSRFSTSTWNTTSTSSTKRELLPPPPPPLPTEAEAYARTMRPKLLIDDSDDEGSRNVGSYWLKPTPTGGTGSTSRNPFRQ